LQHAEGTHHHPEQYIPDHVPVVRLVARLRWNADPDGQGLLRRQSGWQRHRVVRQRQRAQGLIQMNRSNLLHERPPRASLRWLSRAGLVLAATTAGCFLLDFNFHAAPSGADGGVAEGAGGGGASSSSGATPTPSSSSASSSSSSTSSSSGGPEDCTN